MTRLHAHCRRHGGLVGPGCSPACDGGIYYCDRRHVRRWRVVIADPDPYEHGFRAGTAARYRFFPVLLHKRWRGEGCGCNCHEHGSTCADCGRTFGPLHIPVHRGDRVVAVCYGCAEVCGAY